MPRFCRLTYHSLAYGTISVLAKPCPDRVAIEFSAYGIVDVRPGDVDVVSGTTGLFLALGPNGGPSWYHESRLAAQRWTGTLELSADPLVCAVLEYFEGTQAPSPDSEDLPQPAITGV